MWYSGVDMECEVCKTTEEVSHCDWEHYFCPKCSHIYFSEEAAKNKIIDGERKAELIILNQRRDEISRMFKNIVLLPFKLLWNIIVTGLIIGAFILWFSFIFGSVIAVVLILIFKPDLLLLPMVIVRMYIHIWDD